MPHIVIVGAGVIGLSTALAIAENNQKKYKMSVVSEYGPETSPYPAQYTSPWAGAHFRPFPSKNSDELRDYPLSRATLKKFKELAKTNPESSIEFVKGVEYFEAPDVKYKEVAEGWSEEIDNFKILHSSEIPNSCVLGAEYDTFVVNSPLYLQCLYRKLKFEHDVTFFEKKLEKLKDAVNLIDPDEKKDAVIVNCTGNGLQWDGGYDEQCYPIRGQTLLINPPKNKENLKQTVTHQSKDGLWTFYIPRPLHGGVILGGTKQPHDTFAGEREEDTKTLITRGARLFPELMKTDKHGEKYFDIVRVNVGFRPARNGGVRISKTKIDGFNVIHGYGCGGSGYEFSWGVALRIVELLGESRARL